MTANEALKKVAEKAKGLGLQIRFCTAGVLVICTSEDAGQTDQIRDQPHHVPHGEERRQVRDGQGQGAAQQGGAQGRFDALEETR